MAYYRTIERIGMLAPMAPEVLDLYNFDKAEKETALADGVPPEYIRQDEEIAEIRTARAEAAQQQQQMDQAAAAAKAASDLGNVPQNSPVGQALRGANKMTTTPGMPAI
jgi:hypothetical protein